jgi:hypothetical protein
MEKLGDELEDRLHMQRLAVFDGQFGHLRLADRLYAQLENRLVEALRQQAVDHVLANLASAKRRLITVSGTLPARKPGILAYFR